MSNVNILPNLLRENQLTGPNYVDWKRNMDIALIAHDYKFVVVGERPQVPDEDDTPEVKAEFAKWTKANDMAKCYIMGSMSNVLQFTYEGYEYAADILVSLRGMFAEHSRPAKTEATKKLMNAKMVDGTPVRDHVLHMMSLFNELDVLGSIMDPDMKVDIVLNSLPASFANFKLNFNMNKLDMALPELLQQLQTAETIIKEQKPTGTIHIGEATSGASGSKTQKKKFKKKNHKPQSTVANTLGVRKGKGDTPKGKCFHCQKPGHWKRNCKEFLEKKKKNTTSGVPDNQASK